MSTRSKAVQGSNQTREGLESPGFSRGEEVNNLSAPIRLAKLIRYAKSRKAKQRAVHQWAVSVKAALQKGADRGAN